MKYKEILDSMKMRIDILNDVINQANIDYYQKDAPVISDAEYDDYLRELEFLEQEYPKVRAEIIAHLKALIKEYDDTNKT